MNNKSAAICLLALLATFDSSANGLLDSVKSKLGMENSQSASQSEASALNVSGMLGSLTSKLGVSDSQAKGGLASIMAYVKDNVSSTDFSKVTSSVPGLSGLLGAAPDVSKSVSSTGGLGGLLDKASNYSDTLKAVNNVKKQFDALGLSPDMISKYITQIKGYLDTPQGQQAKQVVMQGVEKLIG